MLTINVMLCVSRSFTLDNVLSDKDSEAIGQDVLLTLDEDGKVVDSWGKDM